MSLNIFLPSSQFVFAPICFNIGRIYISQNIIRFVKTVIAHNWLYNVIIYSICAIFIFENNGMLCIIFKLNFFHCDFYNVHLIFFLNNAVQIIILKNSRKWNILCITFKIFSYTVVYVFEQVFAHTWPSKSSLIVLLWTNIFQHFVLYRLKFFSKYLIKIQIVESPLNEIVHSL